MIVVTVLLVIGALVGAAMLAFGFLDAMAEEMSDSVMSRDNTCLWLMGGGIALIVASVAGLVFL